MKLLRKVLSLAVCLMMALSLVSVVKAENGYTITAPDNNHTYSVFQIFTGDLSGSGTDTDPYVLSNIKWGKNGSATWTINEGTDVDESVLDNLEAVKNGTNREKLDVILDYVWFNTKAYGELSKGHNLTNVPAGYYLIVDSTDVNDKYDVDSLYLAEVVGDITVSPKTGIPTVEKKVKDTNDSTNTTTDWQDSADYDIGDTIPFQLTATLGDISTYEKYYIQFNDTMTHLTYVDGSVTVTVDGVDKTSSFTPVWDAETKQLTVTCADILNSNVGATSEGKIIVTYNATLDEDAVIGSTGNPNKVYLVFSNSPNNYDVNGYKPAPPGYDYASDHTGKTEEDEVIVFTYKVDANKYANKVSDITKLAGAAFELFKKGTDGEYKSLGIKNATKDEDGNYILTDSTATSFEWTGIDDGEYKLVEVITPEGYNTIKPQYFTVTAEHDVEADAPALKSLSGNAETGSVITFTADTAAGSLTTNVINNTGSVLPSTGGTGTTILYAGGSILMLAAGILLVSKKRMTNA